MHNAGHVGKYSYDYINRAPDKREYLVLISDNFCQFCTKTYVVSVLHKNLRCEGSQHTV